ncbi:MAG: hypothetical protein QW744_00420 [Candidatus Bathyarchaeia archaeon]
MKWKKMGLIYCPSGKHGWDKHSAMTPTPVLIDEDTIRVYVGFRDEHGVSRIGFVDVDAEDPSLIKNISKVPILNIGRAGAFDDNGVILGDIVRYNDKIYMYYVGFQLVKKVKFLAFTGLAISKDFESSFQRYSEAPILDRSDEGLYIRAIHSVIIEKGIFKIWYAAGNGWKIINNMPRPCYCIKYQESHDGINLKKEGVTCIIPNKNNLEYRIGRPRVLKINDKYIMFYTYGTTKGDYLAGYAESNDGINWVRKDDKIGITLSKSGWDSFHLCYPTIISYNEKTYMFYNGNNMGKTGFGYAILEHW